MLLERHGEKPGMMPQCTGQAPHVSRAEAEHASLATLALSSVRVSLGVTERTPAVTCRGGESVSYRRTDRAFGPILAAATALKNGRFVHRTGHQLK